VPIAAGVVLLLTGAFQLTPWKARQLGHCRAGLACGSSPSGDLRSAGRLGLRYGVHCGLCCAGFMLVLLVTGMMSLLTIVVVAAAITIERLTSRSEWAVRAAGFIALGIGALILLRGVR
jgi:predicted metal-binding membrane protein